METLQIEGLPIPEGLVAIVVGAVLILAGRRVFWLALGVAAFSVGALASTHLPVQLGSGGRLLLALACGFVGILLAVFLRRVAVAIGGFLIGALLGLHVAPVFGSESAMVTVVAAGIGGVVGWVLSRLLVNGGLIVLSSLMGALLVAQNLPLAEPLSEPLAGLVLLGLALLGVAVQSRGWGKGRG